MTRSATLARGVVCRTWGCLGLVTDATGGCFDVVLFGVVGPGNGAGVGPGIGAGVGPGIGAGVGPGIGAGVGPGFGAGVGASQFTSAPLQPDTT